jgi:hypothetical protein
VSPVELTEGIWGGGGGRGAKSYDGEKIWAFVNHQYSLGHFHLS